MQNWQFLFVVRDTETFETRGNILANICFLVPENPPSRNLKYS